MSCRFIFIFFLWWASDIYYHFQHLCSYDFIIILWERNKVGVISNVTSSDFFYLLHFPDFAYHSILFLKIWLAIFEYILSFLLPDLKKKIMSTETVSFLLSKIEWVAKISEEKLWDIPTSTCSQCDL